MDESLLAPDGHFFSTSWMSLHAGKLNSRTSAIEPTQIPPLDGVHAARKLSGAVFFDMSGNLEKYSLRDHA